MRRSAPTFSRSHQRPQNQQLQSNRSILQGYPGTGVPTGIVIPCRTFLLAFSCQPCYNSPRCRVRISAIIVASQASEAGSIPVPCSKEQPSFRYNGMTVISYLKLLLSNFQIDKNSKMPVYTHFNSLNSWQESLQDSKLYDIINLKRWCFYEIYSR